VEPGDADYSTEANPHKGNRGLTRAWHAAKNSWSGLVFAVREESAFRQELTLAACLIPLALAMPFGALERLMLVGSTVLVLIVELVNSGVEAAIDRISFEHHGLSKRAKDYGSAAVMLALLLCGLIWATLGWQLIAG
jgi:diacylglycerol kinase (ATP)